MSEFKALILKLSIASVVFGIIFMLSPNGKLQKNVRFNFAVIFLSILFFSVTAFFNIDLKFKENANASLYSAEKIVSARASYLCGEILKEYGYNFEEIEVFTNKNEDGSIDIKRITVKSAENKENLKAAILAVIDTDGVEIIDE